MYSTSLRKGPGCEVARWGQSSRTPKINTLEQYISIQGTTETAGIHYVGITTRPSDAVPWRVAETQNWASQQTRLRFRPVRERDPMLFLPQSMARRTRTPEWARGRKWFWLIASRLANLPGFSASYVAWCVKSQIASRVSSRRGPKRPAKVASFPCSPTIWKSCRRTPKTAEIVISGETQHRPFSEKALRTLVSCWSEKFPETRKTCRATLLWVRREGTYVPNSKKPASI
jgi:hypothetical protein